jgi:glycosyltransferase involved in cell wall biosynthesis
MPKVTVVTPNYNHARYLPKRLDSILNQTFQDFELIILDDASTDNSREVIESYEKDPRVRTIYNAENKGNTFKQWNLGHSHARGEYIWFAESDDYADPLLLETLVDRLDRHPNVGLAFCQSWAVDEDGNTLSSWFEVSKLQYQSSHCSHWLTDYVNSGHDECTDYLFLHNSIPNASAVLLRREVLERAGGVAHDMLLTGDWMTYVNVLLISDIAFVSAPLNYFRQHVGTVRSRLALKKDPRHETRMVQRVLAKRYGRRRLLRGCRKVLPWYVDNMIYWVRRPPHKEVPLPRALGLLAWFAHIHPMAFGIGLRMLSWELMSQLTRRVGLLGLAQKMKSLSGSLNR